MYFLLLATLSLLLLTMRRGTGIFLVSTAMTILLTLLLDDIEAYPSSRHNESHPFLVEIPTNDLHRMKESVEDPSPKRFTVDENTKQDTFLINKEKVLLPRNVNVPTQDYTKRAMAFATDQIKQIENRRDVTLSRVSKSDRYYKPILQHVEETQEE